MELDCGMTVIGQVRQKDIASPQLVGQATTASPALTKLPRLDYVGG